MLIAAEREPKIKRKWWKPRKPRFNGRYWKPWKNSGIWKVRFWQKLKASKMSFYDHVLNSPSEQVHENSTNEISERFINHLEEQISFLRDQRRRKDK